MRPLFLLLCVVPLFPCSAVDPPLSTGAWTLVHIPDTQNYVASAGNAVHATQQMQWITAQAQARNIRFALQVGDLVNDNSSTQWTRIRQSFDPLQGVPHALATGNHDCGPGGDGTTRATRFTDAGFFGTGSPYASQTTLKGFYSTAGETNNTQNSWHEIRVGMVDYLVIACEWGPRDAVVDWMNAVIAAHPFHRVIISVHAYLESATERFDWEREQSGMNPRALLPAAGGVNDGEDIWQKVARGNENVCLISCGHASKGYLRSTGDYGQAVHQMLFNTQSYPEGGEGWLRLLEFLPDDRTVKVRTYSTLLNTWDTDATDQFTFFLTPVSSADTDGDDMPDHYEVRHSFNVSSAADATTDADHDGASNRDEFIAGTDPRDAWDVFTILQCQPGPNGLHGPACPEKPTRC